MAIEWPSPIALKTKEHPDSRRTAQLFIQVDRLWV